MPLIPVRAGANVCHMVTYLGWLKEKRRYSALGGGDGHRRLCGMQCREAYRQVRPAVGIGITMQLDDVCRAGARPSAEETACSPLVARSVRLFDIRPAMIG